MYIRNSSGPKMEPWGTPVSFNTLSINSYMEIWKLRLDTS